MCEWLEKLFIGQEKNKEELKNVDAKSLFHILHNQPILYKNKVSYAVLSSIIYNGCSKGTLKYCVGHLCLVHVTICYQPWIIWPMVYGSLVLFQGQTHLKLSLQFSGHRGLQTLSFAAEAGKKSKSSTVGKMVALTGLSACAITCFLKQYFSCEYFTANLMVQQSGSLWCPLGAESPVGAKTHLTRQWFILLHRDSKSCLKYH